MGEAGEGLREVESQQDFTTLPSEILLALCYPSANAIVPFVKQLQYRKYSDMKNRQRMIERLIPKGNEERSAFCSGFARGLSGPALLYAAPVVLEPVKVDVQPVRRALENSTEAIRSDWVSVGSDIDAAVRKYAETR